MKKKSQILAICLILALSLCLISCSIRTSSTDIVASVGSVSISRQELSQAVDAQKYILQKSDSKAAVDSSQVLDDLIANEIIRQFAQREGLALNEAEIESIRQAQEETYCMMEEAFKTGSENEKKYAELAMENLQEMADVYGVTLEEYQALCVDSLVLSEAKNALDWLKRNSMGILLPLWSILKTRMRNFPYLSSKTKREPIARFPFLFTYALYKSISLVLVQ